MKIGLAAIRGRLEDVRERVARAIERSGRAPGSVRLVAVVKTLHADQVAEVVSLGVVDLGESRVQEAEAHLEVLGRRNARWHLIGHLQRNKAGRAARAFDRVHSVDSIDLAEALSARRAGDASRLAVLVEVNVSGEASKQGVAPSDAARLVEAVARAGFARLRALRERVAAASGLALPELSMGMSGDFEAAIVEGSTMVRVGTALFGER